MNLSGRVYPDLRREGRDEIGDGHPQVNLIGMRRISCRTLYYGVCVGVWVRDLVSDWPRPFGRPFDSAFIPDLRIGNCATLRIVVRMSGIRDDVCLQLLDHGGVIVEKRRVRVIVDEASQFARNRIAGKSDGGLERLYLQPALPRTFVGFPAPIVSTQRTKPSFQPAPKPSEVIEFRHLPPGRSTAADWECRLTHTGGQGIPVRLLGKTL